MNDEGQLYTIEGIAAAALILTTVYLVLNSTMVFTPGDTHVYDMQLLQLGNDVLAVMDQPLTLDYTNGPATKSPLEQYIETNDQTGFRDTFLKYSKTTIGADDNIQFKATIYYNFGSQVRIKDFGSSQEYYRENSVVVTRWVNVNDGSSFEGEVGPQTVLLEVQLWRG